MKQKMKEYSEAIQEEVSNVGESKSNDEEQVKMKQQSSTSLAGKRCEFISLGLQNVRKGMR